MRRFFLTQFLMISGVVALGQTQPVVLKVTTLLDGKGNVIHNTRVVMQDGKIVRIDPQAAPVTYDLSGLTVLPGWIDTHVHIDWHFGPNGKLADKEESPEQAALAYASNAWKTLSAGFTTVQCVGSTHDKDLRDAINRGDLPGPRILTSLQPITDAKLTPDEIRETVRKRKQEGADLIKVFASTGLCSGGKQTMTRSRWRRPAVKLGNKACERWSMPLASLSASRLLLVVLPSNTASSLQSTICAQWLSTGRSSIRRSAWSFLIISITASTSQI